MKKLLIFIAVSFLTFSLKAQENTNYGTNAGNAGTNNTSIGLNAGDVVTGTQNSFLGNTSGYKNTTGNNNTFFGFQSGYYNTTGSQNLFLGLNAGFKNTTGNYNTNLGFYAGFNNIAGSNNVFLGNMAGYNETGSNKLYIDNSNTATPLIYGDFASDIVTINGKVGIGTSTPIQMFNVHGNAGLPLTDQNTVGGIAAFSNSQSTSTLFIGNYLTAPNSGVWLQATDRTNPGDNCFPITINPTRGNVAIGKVVPTHKLHVEGNIALQRDVSVKLKFICTNANLPSGFEIVNNNVNKSFDFMRLPDGTATALAMTIKTDNGNVGIGVSNPSEKLEVIGNISSRYTDTNFPGIKGIIGHLGNAGGFTITAQGANSSSAGSGDIRFNTSVSNSADAATAAPVETKMIVKYNGNVGIGTTNPQYNLDVYGTIRAREVKVDLNGTPADYVFEKSYNLMSLSDVEKFVTTNKHLPGVPSGKEIIENGLNMGEMQNKLLEKVEELTLYSIEQDKKMKAQEEINQQLLNEIKELKNLINQK